MPPSSPSPVFKTPCTSMATRSQSQSQSLTIASASAIPATPTSSLSFALAASSLQSSQSFENQHEQARSTTPSSAQKHQGEPAPAEEASKGKEKEKRKKRARGLPDDDEDQQREKKSLKEEELREGKSWSGKLDDEIIIFDARFKAKDPLFEFERANGGFVEELMMEFHLILLEMHVWSDHRISSLRRKKRGQIKQSLEEIQAEEAKQEANRVRLLAFMNQIQAAVEGISAIDPLRR